MNYRLTKAQKAYWYPKDRSISFFEKCLYFAISCVAIATLIHFTIEPKAGVPIVKNSTGMLSDKQQERLYCSEWATQKIPVVGGTTDAIRNHCKEFGV